MVFSRKSAENFKDFYEKLINFTVIKKNIKIRKTFEKNMNLCYDGSEGIST